MKKLLQDIKTLIQRRPTFEKLDDVTLVSKKIEGNITKISFKEITRLEKLLLSRVVGDELIKIVKKLFAKINAQKGKISQRIKKYPEKKLKFEIEMGRRQAAIDAIPEIRKYNEGLDDKDSTNRIVKEMDDARHRQRTKKEKGTKIYIESKPPATTWINKDPHTPPPMEE